MNTKKVLIIKSAVQAIVVVGLGYVVRHKIAETHALAWVAAGWLLTAWIVLRIGLALKRGHAKFRAHTESGVNLDNIDKLSMASMSPWSRGYYQMEKKAYRGAWRSMTRKPVVPAGEFSVAGGPNSAGRSALLLMFVLALAALGAVLLPQLATHFWPRTFWFAGAVFAGVYAAIWIIGGRRNLKEGGHRVAGAALTLDLGLRCAGVVALSRIAACRVIEPGTAPAAADDMWMVSPGEPVNVLIALDGPTQLEITAFGALRTISVRFIALYVDRPAALIHAVALARAAAA